MALVQYKKDFIKLWALV